LRFLLDTNVVSELRKGTRANAQVRGWFAGVEDAGVHLSAVVVGELRRGVELLRRRDPRQAAALDRWLETLVARHEKRILPVDRVVADLWGRWTAQRAGSVTDLLQAATAHVHGLTFVTRNVRDVAWTGIAFLNPFQAEA
jgi:predicted nucleic acid-binding protein